MVKLAKLVTLDMAFITISASPVLLEHILAILRLVKVLKLFFSILFCIDCLGECKTCVDSQTCETCQPGDGLYNNTCMSCPAGTHLSSAQICEGTILLINLTFTFYRLSECL